MLRPELFVNSALSLEPWPEYLFLKAFLIASTRILWSRFSLRRKNYIVHFFFATCLFSKVEFLNRFSWIWSGVVKVQFTTHSTRNHQVRGVSWGVSLDFVTCPKSTWSKVPRGSTPHLDIRVVSNIVVWRDYHIFHVPRGMVVQFFAGTKTRNRAGTKTAKESVDFVPARDRARVRVEKRNRIPKSKGHTFSTIC